MSTVYSISGKLCSKYLCHRDDDVVFNESKTYSINRNTIFSNVRWAICSDTHRFSFEIFHRVEHYVHYNLLTPSFDSFGNMSSILSSSWITNTWALIYGRPSFFQEHSFILIHFKQFLNIVINTKITSVLLIAYRLKFILFLFQKTYLTNNFDAR